MADKKKPSIDFDPYEMLQVDYEAQEKEIVRAYRKMALKWHPDKHPQNQEYAESMFLKVSKALEILTDAPARAALDKLRKAKAAAAARFSHLDAKRQKLRADLEAREANANVSKETEEEAKARFEKEIERLRKEGSDLLRREREEIEKQVHTNAPTPSTSTKKEDAKQEDAASKSVKVTWKAFEHADGTAQHYEDDQLETLFSKWGTIVSIVSKQKKKRGTAILEFATRSEAENAVRNELGLDAMPMTVELMVTSTSTDANANKPTPTAKLPAPAPPPPEPTIDQPTTVCDTDFENLVLRRLRQAEERKRLIEEMQKEENDHVTVLE